MTRVTPLDVVQAIQAANDTCPAAGTPAQNCNTPTISPDDPVILSPTSMFGASGSAFSIVSGS